MTSTVGAIFRAGMIAGVCSGTGFAVMTYGKGLNHVQIQGGEGSRGRLQVQGLGPIAANPKWDQLRHLGALSRSDNRWAQGQWNSQLNLARGVRPSQEAASCRSVLGNINSVLQSHDLDGVKIFHLDLMSRLTRMALDEELDNRPDNRQFDPALADDVDAVYALAQEEISNDRKLADYRLRNSLLLGLLGMTLVFLDSKMKRGSAASLQETRQSLESVANTLASGHFNLNDLSQLRYLRVSFGLVGAAIAAAAGGMAVHNADSARRAHAPIPASECVVEAPTQPY